jgi:hypothetical protein
MLEATTMSKKMHTKIQSLLLCLGVALACSPFAHATDSQFKFLEIAYADQNPDFANLPNEEATVLLGNIELDTHVFFSFRYQDGSGQLPIQQKTDKWYSYGIGFNQYITENLAAYIGYEHNVVKGSGKFKSINGPQYNLGLRYTLNDWFFGLELGYNDVFENKYASGPHSLDGDIIATYEAGYTFYNNFAVVLRIRDTADIDLTSYEVGLRYIY